MTTGNVLYLVMVIGVFVLFSAVLGYQSWLQSRPEPATVRARTPEPAHAPEPHGSVPA
jgi:hypothetical protein